MPIHSQQSASFIVPKTHPGLYENRNNKVHVIFYNTPKILTSHKSKSVKCNLNINEKLFQNEMKKPNNAMKKST